MLIWQGIPTRAQLVDRWSGVSRVTRQLAAIPQGQGGPLSIAVASLASALKVPYNVFHQLMQHVWRIRSVDVHRLWATKKPLPVSKACDGSVCGVHHPHVRCTGCY